jgi:hypothetical protein
MLDHIAQTGNDAGYIPWFILDETSAAKTILLIRDKHFMAKFTGLQTLRKSIFLHLHISVARK